MRSSPAAALISLLALLVTACGTASEPSERALRAVHRLEVVQCGGADHPRATGVALAPDLVATVAHALTRAAEIAVIDERGEVRLAEVAYLDEARDVAVVRLDTPSPAWLDTAEPTLADTVTIVSYGDEDGVVSKEGVIVDLVSATLDGQGRRDAVKLEADIQAGDSGAPLLTEDEEVVGMVFATARRDAVGWAISSTELAGVVDEVRTSEPEAVPPPC